MKSTAEKVYKSVKIFREQENARRAAKAIPMFTYAPGGWAWFSRVGIKPRLKCKRDWIGPAQVIEVVGLAVYKIRDLNGVEFTVHAVRMWFYDTKEYIPQEHLDKVYNWQLGPLEVDTILDFYIKAGTAGNFAGRCALESRNLSAECN